MFMYKLKLIIIAFLDSLYLNYLKRYFEGLQQPFYTDNSFCTQCRSIYKQNWFEGIRIT